MEKEEELKFDSTPNLELDSNGVLNENGAQENQQYTALLQRALKCAGEGSSMLAVSAAVNERLPPPQQPFWPEGCWQAPVGFGRGASPRCPNFCYPVGYPTYPGFAGSWDASIWWGQAQPLVFHGMSNYPRASYGFVSSQSWPMPVPNCVTSSSGQPLLRGVIKPPQKLSHKHQRLWDAQSAENVQMWNMIGQLQGELADCKGRLIKLEAEISSLRSSATDEPAVEVGNGGITVRGQPSKRGRSKRAVASVGSQPSLQPRARGRKPGIGRTKVVEEAKPNVLEKESLLKVDDNDEDFTSLDIIEQDKNEGISASIIQNNGILEIDDSTFNNQVLHQFHEIQSCGIEFKSPSLLRSNYEGIIDEDSERNTLRVLPPQQYTPMEMLVDKEQQGGTLRTRTKQPNRDIAHRTQKGPEEIETQNGSSWCRK